MPTTTYRPASPRQFDLIKRLLTERDTTQTVFVDKHQVVVNPSELADELRTQHTTRPVSWDDASLLIDALFACGWQERPATAPGYYATESGDFVVVLKARNTDRTYAKVLTGHEHDGGRVTWSWKYAPGVARLLANSHPMTAAEAAQFGHLHGRCIKCLRPLTDPVSVTNGIGPKCAKAFAA
jgi:hypothetical protein